MCDPATAVRLAAIQKYARSVRREDGQGFASSVSGVGATAEWREQFQEPAEALLRLRLGTDPAAVVRCCSSTRFSE